MNIRRIKYMLVNNLNMFVKIECSHEIQAPTFIFYLLGWLSMLRTVLTIEKQTYTNADDTWYGVYCSARCRLSIYFQEQLSYISEPLWLYD